MAAMLTRLRLPVLFALAVSLTFGIAVAVASGARASAAWLLGTAALVLLWRAIERPEVLARRRKRLGLCVQCGYDLTSNLSGVCPECGEVTSPSGILRDA